MPGTPEINPNQEKPEEFVATGSRAILRMRSGASVLFEDAPEIPVTKQERVISLEGFTNVDRRKAISRLQSTVGNILDTDFEIDVDLIRNPNLEGAELGNSTSQNSKILNRLDAQILRLSTMLLGNDKTRAERIQAAIREKSMTFQRSVHFGDTGDIITNRSEAICDRVEKFFEDKEAEVKREIT